MLPGRPVPVPSKTLGGRANEILYCLSKPEIIKIRLPPFHAIGYNNIVVPQKRIGRALLPVLSSGARQTKKSPVKGGQALESFVQSIVNSLNSAVAPS